MFEHLQYFQMKIFQQILQHKHEQGIINFNIGLVHYNRSEYAVAIEKLLYAEKLLTEKRVDATEFAALSARIEKELARLKVVRKRRRRKERPQTNI